MSEAGDPDMGATAGRCARGAWPARVTHLLFALIVWFIATFAFLGELGQWRDDPSYCIRNHATGENLLTLGKPTVTFFYRPLYYMTVPWLQTELGGHWTNHLISALVTGAVATLTYVLLRRLGVWRGAASAAAIWLVVMPQTWEVVFYLSAMPTGLSCLTFLILSLVSLRWFQAAAIGGWRMWGMPPVIFALALAVPCWNEQVGAAAPALFFLSLGERRSDGKRPWLRGVVAAGAACAAQALYVGLYWATNQNVLRGNVETIVRPHELPERLTAIGDGMAQIAFMRHGFGQDALRAGFGAMADHPGPATAMLVCVVIVSGGWMARVSRDNHADSARSRDGRALAAIAFGLCVFALAWLPLIIIRGQGVESRAWFAPAMGAVVALAGMLQLLTRTRLWKRRGVKLVFAAAFLAVSIPSLVAMVGVQSGFHRRKELNERQAEQLRRLVPHPPSFTVFVPLEVMRPAGYQWSRFHETFTGPCEHGPAAVPAIRAIYRRSDLAMGWRKLWNRSTPGLGATSEGLVYDDRLMEEWMRLYRHIKTGEAPPTTLAWSRVIPFVLDPAGNVVLVSEVSVAREDGVVQTFRVEAVHRHAAKGQNGSTPLAHVRLHKDDPIGKNEVTFLKRAN